MSTALSVLIGKIGVSDKDTNSARNSQWLGCISYVCTFL